MRNFRSNTSFAVAMLAALCSANAETVEVVGASVVAQPAGATAEALASATESAAAETRKRAAASNFLPIVRGRLPLVFVHAVRFDPVVGAMGNKDIATKFATSVGKVFDIKKGRNFAYITAEYKPSAEDLAAAQAWIDQIGAENAKGLSAVGDKTLMTTVLEQYKSGGLASAEDIAKLTAARGATRVPKSATPTAGVLAGKAKVKTGEKVDPSAGNTSNADDLLA